ncbi:hypothetical protein CsSME_00016098 [Camellia sinensis var. sinensis]
MERQQGGWNPVFRRRQGRNGAAAQLHTIFVDEIPHLMNPKGLYTIFSNFGVVKDVYIPDKRRKATKTRFGFVRYDCPVAAEIAIQKANGVWCGDKALKVKKADFGKEKTLINPRPRAYKQDGVSTVSGAGIGGRHSYADVLKGGRSGSDNHIRIQAEEYAIGWLLLSAVIKLRPHCNFDVFKIECHNRGLKDIQLREGGGRNAFITFNSKEEMKQLLTSYGGWLSGWCESIFEWNKGVKVDNERLVWLSCFGMPPNLWNVNNFRKIGEACGVVVELDDNVSSMKSLKCGKIRICTSHLELIDKLVILEKDGRAYPVRVVEERDLLTTSLDRGDHCSATHHASRSEGDDAGNIGADVERSLYMAHSKKSKEAVVGAGYKHTCPSDSVSVVNETGVEIGIRNHDAVHPALNVSLQAPLQREVDRGERRGGGILDTPNGPHGLIRSLSSEDVNRPAIALEVVLSKAQFDGNCLGPNKAKISSVKEANPIEEGEASDNIEDESSPSDEEEEIHQPGASGWDRKAEAQLNESRGFGKFWRKKGQKGIPFRNGFQRGALVRAATTASSSSLSITNALRKQNRIRKEAEATVQLGKALGLEMNGQEAEIVDRVIQMEIEDMERRKAKGVAPGA